MRRVDPRDLAAVRRALAWTPFVLVGASGFFASAGWRAVRVARARRVRLGTGRRPRTCPTGSRCARALVVAYVVARAVHEVRAGRTLAAGPPLGVARLPRVPAAREPRDLAPAIRAARALEPARRVRRPGGHARAGASATDRPIPTTGLWSAWPLALGVDAGRVRRRGDVARAPASRCATAARPVPGRGVRARRRRGVPLTLTLVVGAGWFRSLVLAAPVRRRATCTTRAGSGTSPSSSCPCSARSAFSRSWTGRPRSREALRWLAAGLGLFLALPLVAGANAVRLLVFAIGAASRCSSSCAGSSGAADGRPSALAGVLAARAPRRARRGPRRTRAGPSTSGLEAADHPALVAGPLRWPEVSTWTGTSRPDRSRATIAGARRRALSGLGSARRLLQQGLPVHAGAEPTGPRCCSGAAILFGLHDALGLLADPAPRLLVLHPRDEPAPGLLQRLGDPDPVARGRSAARRPLPDRRTRASRSRPDRRRDRRVANAATGSTSSTAREPRRPVVPAWTVVDGAEALERC